MIKKKFIEVDLNVITFENQDVILITSGQKDGDFTGTYATGDWLELG